MLHIDELLPDESLLTKAKSKGFWLYFFTLIVAPVSYGIKVIVSNGLSVEDVGLIYALLGFVGIASVYNDLGLTDALQYFVPKLLLKKERAKVKGLLYLTMALQIGSGVLVGGAYVIGANWLATNYFSSPEAAGLVSLFGVYFFVVNIFQALQSFAFAVQRVKREKSIETVRMVIVCASTGLLFMTDGLSLATFALSWMGGLVVATSISALFFYRQYWIPIFAGPAECTRPQAKEYLAYGFWALVGSNAWTIIAQIDLQLVVVLMGREMAGYWTNFMSLNSLSTYAFVPLLSFMFPVFTELITKKKFALAKKLKDYLIWGSVAYGIVLGILASTYGVRVAEFFFGEQYTLSGSILEFSAFLLFTPLLGIINFQYLKSHGKVRRVSIVQIGVLVIHAIASVLIIKLTGTPHYLALMLLISHALFFIATQLYIEKEGL